MSLLSRMFWLLLKIVYKYTWQYVHWLQVSLTCDQSTVSLWMSLCGSHLSWKQNNFRCDRTIQLIYLFGFCLRLVYAHNLEQTTADCQATSTNVCLTWGTALSCLQTMHTLPLPTLIITSLGKQPLGDQRGIVRVGERRNKIHARGRLHGWVDVWEVCGTMKVKSRYEAIRLDYK